MEGAGKDLHSLALATDMCDGRLRIPNAGSQLPLSKWKNPSQQPPFCAANFREDLVDVVPPSNKRRKGVNSLETSRRKSHNMVEQKRRQKINELMDQLRELLGQPFEHQNKAAILEGAISDIMNLRETCSKLMDHYQQLKDDYQVLLCEAQPPLVEGRNGKQDDIPKATAPASSMSKEFDQAFQKLIQEELVKQARSING